MIKTKNAVLLDIPKTSKKTIWRKPMHRFWLYVRFYFDAFLVKLKLRKKDIGNDFIY